MTSFMEFFKSIGAGVLTLAVFAGLGYLMYTSLAVSPPEKAGPLMTAHSYSAPAPAQPVKTDPKQPS